MDQCPKISHSANIKISGLSYKMGSHVILNDLNCDFYPGITALIGPNGSGKSTLLKIVAKQFSPTQGQVAYHGIKNIGYVPSHHFLYRHLTVLENFELIAQLNKLPKGIAQAIILKTLHQFELENAKNVLFNKFSDGLKKRVCFASQLLTQPNLLILDEPCSGLDPLQRQQLWQTLIEHAQQGRIILVSSHHPQEILTLCQQCLSLNQGMLQIDKKLNALQSSKPHPTKILEEQTC